jgi:hypothetical protein
LLMLRWPDMYNWRLSQILSQEQIV